jgi:hypothetical protein
MENWNPIGWLLLVGGFLFGVIVGWVQEGDRLWISSYAAMLTGLAILVTNLIRTLWRASQRRKLISSRHFRPWQSESGFSRSSKVFSTNVDQRMTKGLVVAEWLLYLALFATGLATIIYWLLV